jgi:hypothetical protein
MQAGGGLQSEPYKDTELARDLKLLCRDQLASPRSFGFLRTLAF